MESKMPKTSHLPRLSRISFFQIRCRQKLCDSCVYYNKLHFEYEFSKTNKNRLIGIFNIHINYYCDVPRKRNDKLYKDITATQKIKLK